jgi:ankyrin repeat protein
VSDPVVFGFGEEELESGRECSESETGQSFHMAVWKGQIEVVSFFLEKWPELANWPDPETGNGALHLAARSGNADVLELLVCAGANPKQTSQKGYTALHVAAWSGFLDCVKVLESRGCDAYQKVGGGCSLSVVLLISFL